MTVDDDGARPDPGAPRAVRVKWCNGCGQEKPRVEFDRDPRSRYDRRARCRSCKAVARAAWLDRQAASHE